MSFIEKINPGKSKNGKENWRWEKRIKGQFLPLIKTLEIAPCLNWDIGTFNLGLVYYTAQWHVLTM